MRVAYADPPYPGQSKKHYGDHPDYAGEVDHAALLDSFRGYDGWLLHTSSVALPDVLNIINDLRFRAVRDGGSPTVPHLSGFRIMAWVKPFAAFKRNVPVAYAWEPVLVKPCRKPEVSGRCVMRDWTWTRTDELAQSARDFIAESITMQRGLVGAKPEAVCRWAFEMLGMEPTDELVDLFPGSGAVTRAWESWRDELTFDRMDTA